jgi:putative membrane protein
MGSTWFVAKQIQKWDVKTLILLSSGAVGAWAITDMPRLIDQPEGILLYGWLMLAGSLAVFAMLLPGISGSYVLMILGAYPLVIENLAKLGRLEFSSLQVLAPLGFGIAFGALFFSKLIAFALKEYKQSTLTMLLGFMVGASCAVWPFEGIPPFASTTFLSFATMCVGAMCVVGIESLVVRTSQ